MLMRTFADSFHPIGMASTEPGTSNLSENYPTTTPSYAIIPHHASSYVIIRHNTP